MLGGSSPSSVAYSVGCKSAMATPLRPRRLWENPEKQKTDVLEGDTTPRYPWRPTIGMEAGNEGIDALIGSRSLCLRRHIPDAWAFFCTKRAFSSDAASARSHSASSACAPAISPVFAGISAIAIACDGAPGSGHSSDAVFNGAGLAVFAFA